jgi:hypothetical protein
MACFERKKMLEWTRQRGPYFYTFLLNDKRSRHTSGACENGAASPCSMMQDNCQGA